MESIEKMLLSEETRIILSFAQIGGLIAVVWAFAKMYFLNKEDKALTKKEIDDIKMRLTDNESSIEKNSDDGIKLTIMAEVTNSRLQGIDLGIQELKQIYIDSNKK